MEQIDRERLATVDNLVRKAFEAGTRFGAGYPEYDAIPDEEKELQLQAFKDALRGDTWDQDKWRAARQAAQRKRTLQRAETEAGLF